jgi:chaperonin GroES
MKTVPIWDRVIVKVHKQTEKTVKGLIIPGTSDAKSRYEVVSISQHPKTEATAIRFPFKVGDFVLLERPYGHEITEDEETFLILRADDIIAFEPQTGSG